MKIREVDPAVMLDIRLGPPSTPHRKYVSFFRDAVKSSGCMFLITRASGKVSMFE